MPVLLLLLAIPLLLLLVLLLIPVGVVQRYRMGKARQRGRVWASALHLVGYAVSTLLLLASAALTSIWDARALPYTAAGLLVGGLLSLLGLRLTRWEHSDNALFLTPNRWLVLALTCIVAARILYGLVRTAITLREALGRRTEVEWIAESALAGSLAAAGVFLGYYLGYWLGVRRRLQR